MLLFGICFLLYFIKLSGTKGFWYNLRRTDTEVHKAAKLYQKALRKQKKAKHDIDFLLKCKTQNVFPKFVRWKNINALSWRDKNRYYSRNLNNSIGKRRSELKILESECNKLKQSLLDSTTWMKGKLIIFSINRLQNSICSQTKERHQKKLDVLVVNKRIMDGVKPNPNSVITNLTDFELTSEEVDVSNCESLFCETFLPTKCINFAVRLNR